MCSVLNATPLETGSYVRFSSELQDQKCHKSVLMNTRVQLKVVRNQCRDYKAQLPLSRTLYDSFRLSDY